jgi:hypothetical protein
VFYSGGGTQAMTLDASGNLGIGITSYTGKLAANGVIATYASTDNNYRGSMDVESGNLRLIAPPYASNPTNITFCTGTSSTERARITSDGNFGLGVTPTPYAGTNRVLQIDGGANASELRLTNNTTGTGAGNGGLLQQNGNDFYIWNVENAFLSFGTNNSERARFTATGGFTCAGIYNTTVGATNRDVFVDNGGVVGYVSSLRASKTNIANLTDTSWLYQLNPVTFNYRKKDEEGNYTDETDGDIQYGMIAEDVEQVRPDLCFYDEVDGQQELRGIQYSKLVPVMLKALQEQQQMIETLQAKVAALEAK